MKIKTKRFILSFHWETFSRSECLRIRVSGAHNTVKQMPQYYKVFKSKTIINRINRIESCIRKKSEMFLFVDVRTEYDFSDEHAITSLLSVIFSANIRDQFELSTFVRVIIRFRVSNDR